MFCAALPEIVTLEDYNNDYSRYFNYLYQVFLNEIKTGLLYQDKIVTVRRHPEFEGKEDSFYHLTCVGEGTDRLPDLRRSERLKWIKASIMDHEEKCSKECFKLYIKNKKVHLLNTADRYLIVLEPRTDYVLLVTAFYIEHSHTLKKKNKEYEKYLMEVNGQQKTPS